MQTLFHRPSIRKSVLYCKSWPWTHYRSVADSFDLSKGTLHHIFPEVCKVLCELRSDYIRWPGEDDLFHLVNGFQQKTGFPGVIDSHWKTHIPIPAHILHGNSYINRKRHASIQLQAVATSEMIFLDVYTGWPGPVHDAKVYWNSPIYHHLQNAKGTNCHLLGDSAYPLSTTLITRYRDNGHLSPMQKKFNTLQLNSSWNWKGIWTVEGELEKAEVSANGRPQKSPSGNHSSMCPTQFSPKGRRAPDGGLWWGWKWWQWLSSCRPWKYQRSKKKGRACFTFCVGWFHLFI